MRTISIPFDFKRQERSGSGRKKERCQISFFTLFTAAAASFLPLSLTILPHLYNSLSLFSLPLRPMESTRQLKSARLIQKEMAEIFLTETRGLFGNAMITVTVCRMSADLGVAKIYVSLFPVKDKDKLLKTIKEHTAELRGILGRRIR